MPGSRLACHDCREEYKMPSYDLVGAVRARRLQYVGQILRLEEGRLSITYRYEIVSISYGAIQYVQS